MSGSSKTSQWCHGSVLTVHRLVCMWIMFTLLVDVLVKLAIACNRSNHILSSWVFRSWWMGWMGVWRWTLLVSPLIFDLVWGWELSQTEPGSFILQRGPFWIDVAWAAGWWGYGLVMSTFISCYVDLRLVSLAPATSLPYNIFTTDIPFGRVWGESLEL